MLTLFSWFSVAIFEKGMNDSTTIVYQSNTAEMMQHVTLKSRDFATLDLLPMLGTAQYNMKQINTPIMAGTVLMGSSNVTHMSL